MKHIVIFTIPKLYKEVSDRLLFGICDTVAARTKHKRTVFEIDEKGIYIDIRHGNMEKAGGLKPTHVLFEGCSTVFAERWRYNMDGRFEEISSMDELIKMIKE